MKKVTGIFFAASVLCFWVMASLVIAAQSSQQPSTGLTPAPKAGPDLRISKVAVVNQTNPGADPSAGDQLRIACDYIACGCFQNKVFSNRIEIGGSPFYEKEGVWVNSPNNNPNMCAHPTNMCMSYEWVGADTWKATSGSHTIKCILDSNNNIVEGPQGEYNNKASVTIVVPFQVLDKIKDIKTKAPIPVPVPEPR
jgi:hypothetical protein